MSVKALLFAGVMTGQVYRAAAAAAARQGRKESRSRLELRTEIMCERNSKKK